MRCHERDVEDTRSRSVLAAQTLDEGVGGETATDHGELKCGKFLQIPDKDELISDFDFALALGNDEFHGNLRRRFDDDFLFQRSTVANH